MGNLSPRGETQTLQLVGNMTSLDALNLEPVVIPTAKVRPDELNAVSKAKKRGIWVQFSSNRILRFRVIHQKIIFQFYLMINFLFWNIRGVSHAPNLKRLRKLVKMHSISLVAICEPKTAIVNMDMIRLKVGMDCCGVAFGCFTNLPLIVTQWGNRINT